MASLQCIAPDMLIFALPAAAERHVKGVACLGSGYDFVQENSYLHEAGNFMGPKYDVAMLHYWKGYLKQHKEQLSSAPGIDVHAGLHAKSVEVQPMPSYFSFVCRLHVPAVSQHKLAVSLSWAHKPSALLAVCLLCLADAPKSRWQLVTIQRFAGLLRGHCPANLRLQQRA